MRTVLVLVLAACSHPAAAPVLAGRPAPSACDEGRWRDLARSPLRVRLGDRDLVVVDERRGETRVIARLAGALVGGTVPDRALARMVTHETPVWPAPGGSPLPGVVVEPGVPVTGTGGWATVTASVAIRVTGYVPAEVTGRVWEARPPPGTTGKTLGRYSEVLAEPRADAALLASIPGSEPVFDQLEAGPAGWLHVTASDSAVRVTGWVAPPPPPSPSVLRHTYDFSDDTIEGELVRPEGDDVTPVGAPRRDVAAGCIRTSPDDTGDVLGVVTGDLPGTPAGNDWLRVELPTPWGRITGFAHMRPRVPAIPE